jgi:hypothetical protein
VRRRDLAGGWPAFFALVGLSELTSVSKENRQRRESLTHGEKFF